MDARSGGRRAAGRVRACVALLSILTAGLTAGFGRPAAAEPSAADKTLATVLFRDGRALMTEGHLSEACPKLGESQRLDPSGGTILNLALCHEQEGRLALAWSEFNEALAFARRDGRQDRETAAAERLGALEPRLSRLTVVVPESARLAGMRVECDGQDLAAASWSAAIPVDGPEHRVRATAPGHEPFTTTVAAAGEGATVTVEIPLLSLSPVVLAAPPPKPSPPRLVQEPAPAGSGPEHRVRRRVAWVLGAAGVVQVGVASYFGLMAFYLNGRNPTEAGSAGAAADRSTDLWITGLTTMAAAAYLLVTSRETPASPAPAAAY